MRNMQRSHMAAEKLKKLKVVSYAKTHG